MKPIPRQLEVRRLAGLIEIRQSDGDSFRQISAYPAWISALIQPLQARMPKGSNHFKVYRVPVRMSKRSPMTENHSNFPGAHVLVQHLFV